MTSHKFSLLTSRHDALRQLFAERLSDQVVNAVVWQLWDSDWHLIRDAIYAPLHARLHVRAGVALRELVHDNC